MTIFDAASLHDTLARTLAASNIPPDHHNAFALVGTPTGITGVLSVKVGGVWEVAGVLGLNPKLKLDGGFELKASW